MVQTECMSCARPIGEVDPRGAVEVMQADPVGQFHAAGQPEEAMADLGPVAKAEPLVECQLGLALDCLDAMPLRGRVGGGLGDSFSLGAAPLPDDQGEAQDRDSHHRQ